MGIADYFRGTPTQKSRELADEPNGIGLRSQRLGQAFGQPPAIDQQSMMALEARKLHEEMFRTMERTRPKPTPEEVALAAEQQRAHAIGTMQSLQAANDQKMAAVISTLLGQLKSFQPAPLAKVMARDPVLKDLLSKAMLLTPAYEPDPKD